MSDYGGCIVCGVVLSQSDYLRCSDCEENGYMEKTGTKEKFVRLTDDGPRRIKDTDLFEINAEIDAQR